MDHAYAIDYIMHSICRSIYLLYLYAIGLDKDRPLETRRLHGWMPAAACTCMDLAWADMSESQQVPQAHYVEFGLHYGAKVLDRGSNSAVPGHFVLTGTKRNPHYGRIPRIIHTGSGRRNRTTVGGGTALRRSEPHYGRVRHTYDIIKFVGHRFYYIYA